MRPGLYLHVPFCSAICPYCDFAVTTGRREKRRSFAETLAAELRLWGESAARFGGAFDTIYFGGGTPSALEIEGLKSVVDAARQALPIAGDAWISLEVNPEDVSIETTKAWRGLGVRTVSLGLQSFEDSELKFLGRRHRRDEAEQAILRARDAGFDIVSVDLIFGLPGQSLESWTANLRRAVELGVDHVSCYQLTVHEGTAFARFQKAGRLVQMPDGEQGELFVATRGVLEDAGFVGYEVSNFARTDGHRSRHNEKYWRHVPYLGVGPSAHSFDGRHRWWNERELTEWTHRVERGERPIAGDETLSGAELALEAVMLQLRTSEGLDLTDLQRRTGIDVVKKNQALIERYRAAGMAQLDADRLILTPRGLAITDAIARALVLD